MPLNKETKPNDSLYLLFSWILSTFSISCKFLWYFIVLLFIEIQFLSSSFLCVTMSPLAHIQVSLSLKVFIKLFFFQILFSRFLKFFCPIIITVTGCCNPFFFFFCCFSFHILQVLIHSLNLLRLQVLFCLPFLSHRLYQYHIVYIVINFLVLISIFLSSYLI